MSPTPLQEQRARSAHHLVRVHDSETCGRASREIEIPTIMTSCPVLLAPVSSIGNERPKFSLLRLSSLDHLLAYHRELSASIASSKALSSTGSCLSSSDQGHGEDPNASSLESGLTLQVQDDLKDEVLSRPSPRFSSFVVEATFCFSIAMTQVLSEVCISGFALVLLSLLKNTPGAAASSTGSFWPAAILSLVISATLLIWARIADMYGGYLPMMFGLLWLTIWSVIPGLSRSLVVLNIARAMQGLAISALMPSVFVLLGDIYEDGRRKNIILGIYGACAPLGFYVGFVIGGLLPSEHANGFFLITAALSFLTMVTSYLSVPQAHADHRKLEVKMDWLGAIAIITGLVLVNYALATEPNQARLDHVTTAFGNPAVLVPLLGGMLMLSFATWIEGWYATCPLIPFHFFRPRGVKSMCLACLFFYGTFGVWIYETSEYLNMPAVVAGSSAVSGIQLVVWYTPLVVSGMIFSVVGGAITDWVPSKVLLALSGLAWIVAPLLFAGAPTPVHYWYMILPAMVCASLGIDLTFTISNVFLSGSHSREFQGVAGAVSSILFNIGVSFSLPLAQIVSATAELKIDPTDSADASKEGGQISVIRYTFFYATASAAIGFLICLFCFRTGTRH